MFYFRREVTRSLLTQRNLPSIINGQHQIFAFQDREHLPFLCLHQPAMQIFFRTSRLQSEIFAPIQRKSMLAPVKKFAISRENQTFCTDDSLLWYAFFTGRVPTQSEAQPQLAHVQ